MMRELNSSPSGMFVALAKQGKEVFTAASFTTQVPLKEPSFQHYCTR